MVKREAGGKVTKPSKKTPVKAAVKAVAAKTKVQVAKTKAADDIDDIFSSKPAVAETAAVPAKPTEPTPAPVVKDKKKAVQVVDATATAKPIVPHQKKPADDLFGDSRGANSKYTDDGMRVFYMDDLRIGEGEGDTDLCPFECDCCF
ncbi:hypothetical protein EC988_007681 [Linderina pennispora]|nr:hypothetical protein EC988_007681 [Linderina pennispora]